MNKAIDKIIGNTVATPVRMTAGGGGNIDIDNAMSDTSENAVQNKVIKKYVDDSIVQYVEEAILGGEW